MLVTTKNIDMRFFITLILVILLNVSKTCCAQDKAHDYPKVGEQVTDYTFTDLDNFSQKSTKVSDYRGKWLILDFWSYYCSSCIASFPKMDAIQRQFKDQVKVLMIGTYHDRTGETNKYKLTRDTYNRLKVLHGLQFTVAFDNNNAATQYKVNSLPYILVVNPNGIIVAKAQGIQAEQVQTLLNGQTPAFVRAFSENEKFEYQHSLPMLVNGTPANGGNDTSFLFRSLLKQTTYKMPNLSITPLYLKNGNSTIESGRLEVSNLSLKKLYRIAYFGEAGWGNGPNLAKKNMDIVLEIKDSSNFIVDQAALKGLYDYSLIVPKKRSSETLLKKIMQSDLNNYFNYDTFIESRKARVYYLTVIDENLVKQLKTNGGEPKIGNSNNQYFGFSMTNYDFEEVINYLIACIPKFKEGDGSAPPLIDKTGINYKVDFTIDNIDLSNFNEVNKALARNGLQIVKAEQDMETLIIKDRL